MQHVCSDKIALVVLQIIIQEGHDERTDEVQDLQRGDHAGEAEVQGEESENLFTRPLGADLFHLYDNEGVHSI